MLPGAGRVVDARELDEDAAAEGQLLHVGLGHTELVDPLPDDVLGVVDGRFGFRTEDGEDLVVGALLREEVPVLHVVEDAPQLDVASLSGPGLPEEGDEVGVGVAAVGLGLVHCSAELLIRAVIGEGDHEVGNGDLEGHAHATAEVESEIQLALLGFAVGLADDRDDGGVSLARRKSLASLAAVASNWASVI